MQISHKDTNLDDSINLAETHPQKLLERILKLEDRVVLLELIQANIDKGSS
jgi:signal recognition particle GTPase